MGKKNKSGLLKSSINKREITDMVKQFLSARKGVFLYVSSSVGSNSLPIRSRCSVWTLSTP